MNRKLLCGIIGLLLVVSIESCSTDEYVVLTIAVEDLYKNPVDDARVYVSYVYKRPEDADIPDQFTVDGKTSYSLEARREYVVTITKAGFLPHTEVVELEEDTTLTVTLEYQQNTPVLQVKHYTLTPQEVVSGERFQLRLVIENEGTGDALNINVTFTSSQVFSPVQPSSSYYFERLDVGKVTSVTQMFAVSGEALSGVYDLVLTISYQDASGIAHTTQEMVGVSILRKPLIKLLNVDYLQRTEQGQLFTFSVDVANTGRFAVNGLYLEVESDMDWEYTSYYIGSLEAGDFDTFDSEVMPDEAGEHEFIIRVGFVDDFNREHYQEQSFSVTVTERVQETPPPQEDKGLWQRFLEFLKAFLGLD